ncbi:hypothetical protein AAEU40_27990 [Klebsiella pneumoniae]|uniref:hypothetical protein n=1 Tax=Klebsiella pneumoniae TaxID=573 RepID=UPI00313F3ABB
MSIPDWPLTLKWLIAHLLCVVSIFSLIQIFKEQNFTMHFAVHFEIYYLSNNLCGHYGAALARAYGWQAHLHP